MFKPLREWPLVSHNPAEFERLRPSPLLSIDYEWNTRTSTPTILGASDGATTVSCLHEHAKPYFLELLERYPHVEVLGHNFLQADYGVAQDEGIRLDPKRIQDTILWHWLTNMSLCKGTKKADDEEGEKRGRGFMDLYTMCSLYTDSPRWKSCWGEGCEQSGRPCPEHNEYGYNGNDCYWPLLAYPHMLRRARMLGVDSLYPLHRDVSLVLAKMTRRGVLVDVPYINKLRGDFARDSDELCRQLTVRFNPDSPKQIVAYFKGRGIPLDNAQEETVRDACEEYDDADLDMLLEYKEMGNGPDRWFAPREWDDKRNRWKGYVDGDGVIHGSFAFFTSTGRLLAFNPNLQNIEKRRVDRATGEKVGKRIRRAIVPREGNWLYRADYKSAENYAFLYQAGYKELPKVDLHNWLKDVIGLKETDEFSMAEGGAREAAKTVTHSCLPQEHEVLTPTGWISVSNYTDEQIAMWTEDGSLSFVTPERYVQYDNTEPLNTLVGTSLRAAVTCGHTFPVLTSGTWHGNVYENWHKTSVKELPKSGRIPLCGVLDDSTEETLTDLEIQQAVAIQADARIPQRGKRAYFHLVKQRKRDRIRKLFGVTGAACGCHENGERFSVPLGQRILDTKTKSFTQEVLRMSQRQREMFLAEVLLWDGHKSGDVRNVKAYFNTDLVSVRWVQTVAHLSGVQALLREIPPKSSRYKRGYRLSFNRRKYAAVNQLKRGTIPHLGKVYCFTVKSGFFLTRYRNHICVTGNSDYMEGLKLVPRATLPRLAREESAGARLIFPDWTFQDQVVTFTGINLAKRAFGDSSFANRKRALDVQRQLFSTFPKMRDLQRRITKMVETQRCVKTPHGYCLASYGYSEDRLKTAAAMTGSNPVAHFMKLALLNADQHPELRLVLTVHDEVVVECDKRHNPKLVERWIREAMEVETPEMPGLRLPVDVSYGKNWTDQVATGEKA